MGKRGRSRTQIWRKLTNIATKYRRMPSFDKKYMINIVPENNFPSLIVIDKRKMIPVGVYHTRVMSLFDINKQLEEDFKKDVIIDKEIKQNAIQRIHHSEEAYFIHYKDFFKKEQRPPSIQESMKYFGWVSTSNVYKKRKLLIEKGYLKKIGNYFCPS